MLSGSCNALTGLLRRFGRLALAFTSISSIRGGSIALASDWNYSGIGAIQSL